MVSFLLKRLISAIFILIAVVVLISSIIYLAPVDPARLTFGQRTDNVAVANKREQLGLDKPLYVQLSFYLRDISPIAVVEKSYDATSHLTLISGNEHKFVLKAPYFRESYQSGSKVSQMLADAIPKTVLLAFAAFIIAVVLGLLLGIIAAINKDSWIDDGLLAFTTLGYSLPSYVSAIILALIFGYLWSNFTGLNIQGSIVELNDLGDEIVVWKNLILPAIALGIRPIAIITQLTRSALLDVLSENYIRTAKAKGLPFIKVITNHALRNAMNPVFTAMTGWFASLLAGAFFVETVFNFKGIGALTVNALINYDIPVVLGCVIFICSVFIVINILVDIGYQYLDPTVKRL